MTVTFARFFGPKLCLGERSNKFLGQEQTWFFKGLTKTGSQMGFSFDWSAVLDSPWGARNDPQTKSNHKPIDQKPTVASPSCNWLFPLTFRHPILLPHPYRTLDSSPGTLRRTFPPSPTRAGHSVPGNTRICPRISGAGAGVQIFASAVHFRVALGAAFSLNSLGSCSHGYSQGLGVGKTSYAASNREPSPSDFTLRNLSAVASREGWRGSLGAAAFKTHDATPENAPRQC